MKLLRIVGFVMLLGLVLGGCAGPPPTTSSNEGGGDTRAASNKLNVVTTVSPLTNIIYNVGGEQINLAGIIPEGTNSHTFEPAPSDAKKLAEADLIFVNGLNLEVPTVRLAEANKRKGVEIILLGEQTISSDEYVYDFSFPKEAGSPNPHLWTNPLYALRYAEIVRDALLEHDPTNADDYRQNYEAFKARIEALDVAIKETIASIPAENRKLLTYHDSWAYFSPRYDMTVIGAIQPADFAQPSAQEMAGLITQLRQENVPAIFGSEVFPSPVLDQIAREAGVQYIDTLRDDDLPGQPGDPQHSYLGLMVEDVRIMAAGLGGQPELIADFDTSNVTGSDGVVDQAQ